MNRIKLLISAIAFGVLCVAAQAADSPSIDLILAYDLGYGDPGCYNPPSKIPTPHLDRLAAQGLTLTDAHAAAAACSPSFCGLLTGQYPWRTRPRGGVLGPWAASLIAPDRLTLPKLLQQHGYATSCIGKWHLGWTWPTKDGKSPQTGADNLSNVDISKPIADCPTTRGFDYYFGTCVPNYPPYCFIENDRTVGLLSEPSTDFEFSGPKVTGWKQDYILPEITSRAVRYIESAASSNKPLFLYFPLTSPHHPFLPTAEFRDKSGAGDYGDFLVQTDWAVGQVLAALDRTKQTENTLVVFTSDNGPEITHKNVLGTKVVMAIGAYDRVQKCDHASMGPLRAIKYEAWEGGHRVPFLARWPGRIQPGTISGELVCQTDLLATIAGIVGDRLPATSGEGSWNALSVLLEGKRSRCLKSFSAPYCHSTSCTLSRRIGLQRSSVRGKQPTAFAAEAA